MSETSSMNDDDLDDGEWYPGIDDGYEDGPPTDPVTGKIGGWRRENAITGRAPKTSA